MNVGVTGGRCFTPCSCCMDRVFAVVGAERAVNVAVTVWLRLHRKGVGFLQRKVRVAVCEACHLHRTVQHAISRASTEAACSISGQQAAEATDCHCAAPALEWAI